MNPTAKITILAGTSLGTGILSVTYRSFLSDSNKVIMFLPLLPAALVFLVSTLQHLLVSFLYFSVISDDKQLSFGFAPMSLSSSGREGVTEIYLIGRDETL
jgi:hypothetical protein